jgi:putative aldouronate transport system substrate-binding protein
VTEPAALTRRSLLALTGVGTAGLWLAACERGAAPIAPTRQLASATSAPAPATNQTSGETVSGVRLPNYIPLQGPVPDLPGDPARGVDDGFVTFPKDKLYRSVPTPPGKGDDISTLTQTLFPPPPLLEQNAAWQEVNKRLNANLKLNIVLNTDYRQRLSTTIAGGELPDFLYIVPIQSLPQFLQAKCANLTQYLSGDAVKDYPNLAALPTLAWKATVYSGGIYAVPVPRAATGFVLYRNMARMAEVGDAQPTTPEDYKKMLQQLTDPSANKWALGATGGSGSQIGPLNISTFAQMFGVPNNWRLESSGKLTRFLETDELKAAVGFARDLWAAGFYHPNSLTYTNVSSRGDFVAGRFAMLEGAWANYSGWWQMGAANDPPTQIRPQLPLALGGGKPVYWLGVGNFGVTALKNASADRIKELLAVLNYLAAPFGSEEGLLLDYGVEGPDFTWDSKGNPVPSKQGIAEVMTPWRYLTAHPEVLYNPSDATYARTLQGDQQGLIAAGIQDPTLGYYSPTDAAKGQTLAQLVSDQLLAIVTGRSPLSDFDALVKDWASQGGDQIRAEYQQALQNAA